MNRKVDVNWTAPLGKLGSHSRQTVDAIVDVFHRLAAGGYENLTTPNRPHVTLPISYQLGSLFFIFVVISYLAATFSLVLHHRYVPKPLRSHLSA